MMKRELPSDIPAEAVPFLQEMGYLEADRLAPGDPAPDAPLHALSGETVTLARFFGERSVALIFGSYT